MASLKFDITGDNSNVLEAFKGVQDGVRQTQQAVEASGSSIDDFIGKIKSIGAISLAGISANSFVKTMAKTRGEFQQLEVSFTTMLGSEEKAMELMNQLTKTAAETPFDMLGITEGAKKLLAYGTAAEDVNETIRRLGDIAAGLSIDLGSLVRQFGKVQASGQMTSIVFRQLRAMGIPIVQEITEKYNISAQEVSKYIAQGKITAEDFKDIIWNMTSEGSKFGGLMEKQAKTIPGIIRNIEDGIDIMFNTIGKSTEGIMTDTLLGVKSIVENWEKVGAAILAAAETIGIYKAAMLAVSTMRSVSANVGYNAEIMALEEIIPLKKEENLTELEQAVAEGKLTQAKAEKITALRAEAAAYVQELETKALAAKAAFDEASTTTAQIALDLEAAQVKVAACEEKYSAAVASGEATAIETAELELNTAASTENNIAKELEAARARQATLAKEMETTAERANTAATTLNTASTVKDTAAKGLWAQVMAAATRAQNALNASMLGSPLFWIAAAITAVTYGIYKLVTAETAHEKAVRKTNEAWEEFNKKVDERKSKIDSLLRVIKDETATEYQQAESYEELTQIAPRLTEEYSQQELALMDLEKAQKAVNEEMDNLKFDEVKEKVEECKKKIDELTDAYNKYVQANAANATTAYAQGLLSSIKVAETEYDVWYQKLFKMKKLQDEIFEQNKPIEVRLEEAKENEKVRKEIFEFYEEAMRLTKELQESNDEVNYDEAKENLEDFIKRTETELDELRREEKQNPMDMSLRLKEEEKTKVLNSIIQMRNSLVMGGFTTIPFTFSLNYDAAKDSVNEAADKVAALIGGDEKKPTLQEAINEAQEVYANAVKNLDEITRNKNKYDADTYKKAVTEEANARKALKDLGVDVGSKSTKAISKDVTKDTEAYKKLIKDQEKERERLITDTELATRQARINAMEESNERTLEQIRLDFDKEKEELERQYEDLKTKKLEDEKRLWEANPQNEGKKFDENRVDLSYTEAETMWYEARILEIQKEREQAERELTEDAAQAMRDYLIEYGTYQEKRLAIAEDYAEKIRKAQTEGERLTLEKQKESDLYQVEFDALTQKIDWQGVFGSFSGMLGTQLKELLDQLRQYIKTPEFRKMGATDQQTIYDAIERLKEVTPGGEGTLNFKALQDQMDNLGKAINELQEAEINQKEALDNLRKAQEEYENALASGDKDQITAAQNRLSTATQIQQRADERYEQASMDVQGMSEDLKRTQEDTVDGMSLFADGLDDLTSNSLSTVFNGFKSMMTGLSKLNLSGKLGEKINNLTGQLAGIIGEVIDTVLSILDVLSDGIGPIISNIIDSLLGAINGLLDDVLKGKFVKEIGDSLVTGVGGILNTITFGGFSSWFGMSSSDKRLEEDMERLADANDDLQNAIEELTDVMKDSAVAEASDIYEQQIAYLEAQEANTKELMQRAGAAYGSSHSSNYRIDKTMNKDDWERISDIVGESVTSATEFFDLTSEQMYNVFLNATDLYSKIKNVADDGYKDAAQYMDTYIEYWKQYEELAEGLQEKLTSTSFDSVRDSFKDLIMDMEKDADDFSEAFEEMMQEAMVESLMTEKYDTLIKQWYDEFAEAMDDDAILSPEEQENLRQEWNDLITQARNEVEQMYDTLGWDKTAGTQSASTKGFQAMGQDTAEELNGRFTALQIAGENIYQQMLLAVAALNTLVSFDTGKNTQVTEIRNMMIVTNSYLEDMVKYAKLSYTDVCQKLDAIQLNTSRL